MSQVLSADISAQVSTCDPQAGRRQRAIRFWLLQSVLVVSVLFLWDTPALSPLRILVVLMHEVSHGLAAVLTGGKIISVQVDRFEGGLCSYQGGIPWLIISAGYVGSVVWGAMLMVLSARIRAARWCLWGSVLLFLVILFLAVGGFTQWFVLGAAAAVCWASGWHAAC